MKDINTATQDDLVEVPSISPTKAATILDWRKEHGPINDLDNLTEVPGIGEKTVQRISEHFTAGSESGTQSAADDADAENGAEDEGTEDREESQAQGEDEDAA